MKTRSLVLAATLIAVTATAYAQTAKPSEPDRFFVPKSVSPDTAAALKQLYAMFAAMPAQSKPKNLADIDKANAAASAMLAPSGRKMVDAIKGSATSETLGGVGVMRVRPANPKADAAPLIYIHGGGWIFFSAASTLHAPALIAAATGREVISIDYTLAPRGNYNTATDQVVSVWKALLAKGFSPKAMAIFGDSAGGNLTLASTLKIRDLGLATPGAILAMSPATDLTFSGETMQTIGKADPSLDPEQMPWLREAYVGKGDARSPYASPVYGDYTKGFPPTLIQGGTREFLLSDFVREYQAIRAGGQEATLDLYEGMPHVFQAYLAQTSEGRTAIARASAFFDAHLTLR